ncbi:MAG: hypothetical protein LUC98_04655, partial [Lachnospiraceae bacterium]|nr:hypothetical protein [Lachnospiraceae bacterium]
LLIGELHFLFRNLRLHPVFIPVHIAVLLSVGLINGSFCVDPAARRADYIQDRRVYNLHLLQNNTPLLNPVTSGS